MVSVKYILYKLFLQTVDVYSLSFYTIFFCHIDSKENKNAADENSKGQVLFHDTQYLL